MTLTTCVICGRGLRRWECQGKIVCTHCEVSNKLQLRSLHKLHPLLPWASNPTTGLCSTAKSDQVATSANLQAYTRAYNPWQDNSCGPTGTKADLAIRTLAYKPCLQAIASLAMSFDRLLSKSGHSSRELALLETSSWAVTIEHCRLWPYQKSRRRGTWWGLKTYENYVLSQVSFIKVSVRIRAYTTIGIERHMWS